MNVISDIGRYTGFGGGIPSGRLLDDLEQESPAELQRAGLVQTSRLIQTAADDGDGFSVIRGGTGDYLGFGTRQVYAGLSASSSGNEVLDQITGTINKLQGQLDQKINAASAIDPSNQAALQQAMFQVQLLQNQISELTTEATNILKTIHETQMAIVRNFHSN